MIISRTPFRISFFGGGTDYPAWYEKNGGAVLATTVDKYCYISCRYLPPFFAHKSRVAYSKIEDVHSNEEIEHSSIRETLKFLNIQEGVEIHHDGDLPARTGLGSSSSFTVGLLHALYALQCKMPKKMQLAKEAIYIERDLIQESVGSQDQVSAAFGGFNKLTFSCRDDICVEPIIVNRDRLHLLENHLMLFFTGISRNASEIASLQIQNTLKRREELLEMRQLVDEALSLLISERDITEFGRLLHDGWQLKRSLTERISNPKIDAIYEAARAAGAIGGKLLGAGGGGFMLIFAQPENHIKIRERLKKLLHVPFRFETGGSQIIFYDHPILERHDSPYPLQDDSRVIRLDAYARS